MAAGAKADILWDLAPHTKAKHDILTHYLAAWFAILGQSPHANVNVIDGFAGPGIYSKGEPGSPILALKRLLEHSAFERFSTEFNFLFNEQDAARCDSLEVQLAALKAGYSSWPKNVNFQVANENFQDLAQALLGSLKPGEVLAPTFAFIDPFGYRDVPMSLIRDLVSHPSCDLFIYFDFNSICRFATAGNVDNHLAALFGTEAFKEAPASGLERASYLHDLYEKQLRVVCDFAYVRSFRMVNQSGRTGNYLFFCTRNDLAYDRMKAAMWKLSPSGEYEFDDRLAGQTVLFNDDSMTAALQDELTQHFAGRSVPIEEVIEYVVKETPFHSGQVKTKTLKPMQVAGRISSPNQGKKNTYPAGTLVSFP